MPAGHTVSRYSCTECRDLIRDLHTKSCPIHAHAQIDVYPRILVASVALNFPEDDPFVGSVIDNVNLCIFLHFSERSLVSCGLT